MIKRAVTIAYLSAAIIHALACACSAAPSILLPQVADVTTKSISMVWLTDTNGSPSVEVFYDKEAKLPVTGIEINVLSVTSSTVRLAALESGTIKVVVNGLAPSTKYYARAVMRDDANSSSVSYSVPIELTTATKVLTVHQYGSIINGLTNGLPVFHVYVRPSEATKAGIGSLLIAKVDGAMYPITAYIGDGITAPGAILDLNNLYGLSGETLDLLGDDHIELVVMRNGSIDYIKHFRLVPADSGMAAPQKLLRGFFADIDIDRDVDMDDFDIFRGHFRAHADDDIFNPDYDFIEDSDLVIDARDFSRFSRQYGRTNVE